MSPEGILVANQAIPAPATRMQAAVNKSWPKFFCEARQQQRRQKENKVEGELR